MLVIVHHLCYIYIIKSNEGDRMAQTGTYHGQASATSKQISYLDSLADRAGYQDRYAALSKIHSVSRSKAQEKYMSRSAVSTAIDALK